MNTTGRLLIVFVFIYASALTLSVHGQQPQRDGPRYQDGTSLVRPLDYREWPFVGSGLGLTYDTGGPPAAAPIFTNVFVNPASYRAFTQTGVWPNETILVLELRSSQTNAAPNL
jgi:hypothetical protein